MTAKSSGLRIELGWLRPDSAVCFSFLVQPAINTPLETRSLIVNWKSRNALPRELSGPNSIPLTPTSPMTPPQSVLSKSRTKHFFDSPRIEVTTAAKLNASLGCEMVEIASPY